MHHIEREYVPAAKELRIDICSWGPLASDLLTGHYKLPHKTLEDQGRLTRDSAIDPHINPNSHQILNLMNKLEGIAQIREKTPNQIALNWIANRPNITSTIIGASNLLQLEENLWPLEFEIPTELVNQLDTLSNLKRHYSYFFYSGDFLNSVNLKTYINN